MDIYDRDDSLFYNQEQDEQQRELNWHDNVFGERIGEDTNNDSVDQPQHDNEAPPTAS